MLRRDHDRGREGPEVRARYRHLCRTDAEPLYGEVRALVVRGQGYRRDDDGRHLFGYELNGGVRGKRECGRRGRAPRIRTKDDLPCSANARQDPWIVEPEFDRA